MLLQQLLGLYSALPSPPPPNYSNPIIVEAGVDLGDPGALWVNGSYFLATSSGDAADAFPIHRSHDLRSWELVGHVFPAWRGGGGGGGGGGGSPSWAVGDFWAPDLQLVDGRVACYFSARARGGPLLPKGVLSLGVAFSSGGGVEGPFADVGQPLWQDNADREGTIDVHYHEVKQQVEQVKGAALEGGGVVGATRGSSNSSAVSEKYLLWKANQHALAPLSAHIMLQRLADDGASFAGGPSPDGGGGGGASALPVLSADEPWEKFGCVEAPWLVQRGGAFYLFYSGSMVNFDTYGVGVARAMSVTGPYEKHPSAAPILRNCAYGAPPAPPAAGAAALWTPGHCAVLPVGGGSGGGEEEQRWVMFYHGRNVSQGAGTNRTLFQDELRWDDDGWPYLANGCPSGTSLPVP
jgi:beta-xylosidase